MQVTEIIEQVFTSIELTDVGTGVTDLLVPDGNPLLFENSLWDFKRKPPTLAKNPDKEARDKYKYEIHELIKDIVSFHNSYGGYLIFGVEDSGLNRIVGCDAELDLGDLEQRIKALTGADLTLYQNRLEISTTNLLLLLIPRRRSNVNPLHFLKAATPLGKKRAFEKGSIYVRVKDQCRPANNSTDDWKFLFSERKISSSDSHDTKDRTPSNLPPRDPDLVRFVGRADELSLLRAWILDPRNPIKLISGMGGLGKTSVAYRFSEELASTGAGNFDFIAWVTAKKSTFSALRGEMVKTTRHDFSTTDDLLKRLITLIAGESSIDDDMDQGDLIETLTDALIYQPSFIVVDDLDSLSPNEQRACATILQQIVFRTVDRDHAPSKILLTSRLDQGLAPTTVIKISGLGQDEFEQHIYNLCKQFELDKFRHSVVKEIYKTASGSPLFASAIVRLAKLGENPKDICKTWATRDGEEIREFAFKRELDRLSNLSASILLAVVNLEEVGTEELLEVVETTKGKLRDHISELQSFHLLSKTENSYGDPVLTTSKELVASAEILRKKLGQRSQEVERRCATIRKNQGDQTRIIGRKIREIVGFWNEGNYPEALIVAKDLAMRNPKNGDVLCALAGANLKVSPKQYIQADNACTKAIEYSCARPELFDYTVLAKQGVEDWQGLLIFSEKKHFNYPDRDPALDAFLTAISRLINLANERGNPQEASNYAMRGIRRIFDKISGRGLEPNYFRKLVAEQNRLAQGAIADRRKSMQSKRDHLNVSDLGFDLIKNNVQTREVVTAICESLEHWCNAVKNSPMVDEAEIDIITNNLKRLDRLSKILVRCTRDTQKDLDRIQLTQKQLQFLGGSIGN